jgi:hypothetical protein
MATCWAEAAARLDHQHALLSQFDKIVSEAKRRLSGSPRRASAIDGNGPTEQMNGNAQKKRADGVIRAKHERQLPREGGETSSE